jgi:hypothetical protein
MALDDPSQTREQVTLGVDTHAELHVAAALDARELYPVLLAATSTLVPDNTSSSSSEAA